MSARALNKVMLIGNLTRDPELRYTPTGTAVCTFGLATNRSWTPSDGSERKEETEFHKIVAWSKLAEICSQILTKGRKTYVEGRIQNRKWQTQEGQERETTEIVIDNMIVLGAPKGGYNNQGSYGQNSYQNQTQSQSQVQDNVVVDPVQPADEVADDEPLDVIDSAVAEAEEVDSKKTAKKTAKSKEEEISVDDIPF